MQDIHYPAGWETVSRALAGPPGRIALLCGGREIFPLALALAAATRQPFAVVDGAMRFNSYTLSRIAVSLGQPPKELLRRTHVTRSFTAFQTEAALSIKLPRFLRSSGCRLAVILGLLDTYYDEQIRPRECRHSIARVASALRDLTRGNVHILIADVEVSPAPPGKEMLFRALRSAAGMVITLERAAPDGFALAIAANTQQRALSWDATTTPSPLSSTITAPRGASSAAR